MEVTGTIKVIEETQHVSDKFRKREFVVTTGDTYPQHLLIQTTQDKVELLANYKVGDKVKVSINLRGREWNGPQGVKYFNSIEAWRIESVGSEVNGSDDFTTNNDPTFKPANTNDNSDLPY